jgi:hypothetical protein
MLIFAAIKKAMGQQTCLYNLFKREKVTPWVETRDVALFIWWSSCRLHPNRHPEGSPS